MKLVFVAWVGLAAIVTGCKSFGDVSDVVKNNVQVPATSAIPASRVVALRAELEAMFETDQMHRGKFVSAKGDERAKILSEMNAIDKANQARLGEIYAEVGWPTISVFGNKAVEAAFLIAQHSSSATMQKYYVAIKQAVEKGEMRKSDFALFEDRLRMYDGRPQLYGSQVTTDKTGKQVFWKIEDEANVDIRRAQMGLPPLAEYAKYFKGIDYVPFSQRDRTNEKEEAKTK
jgi:hypothetical protein